MSNSATPGLRSKIRKKPNSLDPMNYRIRDIAPIIGVDADVLLDAARIMGYRRVAGLLCVHGSMSPEFVDEAWRLQKMKDSATARGKKSGAPGFNRYTEGNREPGFRQFFSNHRLFRWSPGPLSTSGTEGNRDPGFSIAPAQQI